MRRGEILRLLRSGWSAWCPANRKTAYICPPSSDHTSPVFNVRVSTLESMVEEGTLRVESIGTVGADTCWYATKEEDHENHSMRVEER